MQSSSVARRPGVEQPGPGGDDQGAVGARERGAERLDGAPIDLAVLLELREVVDEGGVDHAIRHGRAAAQAFQVFEVASMHLGTGGDERLGARIRASEAEHLMARVDELLNDGRTDKARAPVTKTRIAISPLLHSVTASAVPLSPS